MGTVGSRDTGPAWSDMTIQIRGRLSFLLILLLVASELAAEEEALPVFNLLPSSVDQLAAEKSLGEALGISVRFEKPDPHLVEALAWMDASGDASGCGDQAATLIRDMERLDVVPTPGRIQDLFHTLIAQANRQLLFVEDKAALKTVQQARAYLPCVDQLVALEDVRALFLNEAVAHLRLGDGQEHQSLLNVLAVDPRVYLESDYAPNIRKAYMAAASHWSQVPPIGLRADVGHVEFFLNGQPVAGLREVRSGLHILQGRAPDGTVRSTWLEIPRDIGIFDLNASMNFGLRSAEEVTTALAERLAGLQLTPADRQAMDRHLKRTERLALFFAVLRQEMPAILIYRAETGTSVYSRSLVEARVGLEPLSSDALSSTDAGGEHTIGEASRKPYALSAGISFQRLGNNGSARFTGGLAFGSAFQLDYDTPHAILQMRFAIYPAALRSGDREGCTPDAGTLSMDDVDAAMRCLPAKPSVGIALGAGIPMVLSDRMSVIFSGYGALMYVSDVVVFRRPEDPGSAVVARGFGWGPQGQVRFRYAAMGGARPLSVVIDLAGGTRFLRVAGQHAWTLRMALTAGISHAF